MLDAVVKPGAFTEEDQFVFESWGYLVVPNVLNDTEVQACLEASERLHGGAVPEKGIRQVGNGFENEPALESLIDHPALLPKIRGLFHSDNIILQAAWCTIQPSGGGNGGWHQDGSSAFDFKLLGYPIPLLQLRAAFLLTDQSEPGLGNMEMIPGSHRSRAGMPASYRKGEQEPPISQVICAPAGSALLFHNAVWHRTYKHHGDFNRYTMHYVYSPPWMRFADRFADSADFLERVAPERRALFGDYSKPDSPYAGGYLK